MSKIENHKICEDCDGEGQREYERGVPDYVFGGELVAYYDTCDTCDGWGSVPLGEE